MRKCAKATESPIFGGYENFHQFTKFHIIGPIPLGYIGVLHIHSSPNNIVKNKKSNPLQCIKSIKVPWYPKKHAKQAIGYSLNQSRTSNQE